MPPSASRTVTGPVKPRNCLNFCLEFARKILTARPHLTINHADF